MELEYYILDFHFKKIESLKLDFLFSLNWSGSLFTNMPPKWKSSFKDLISTGIFFFFCNHFCSSKPELVFPSPAAVN